MTGFFTHTFSYWGAGGWLLLPLAGVCVGIWGYFLRSREQFFSVIQEADSLSMNPEKTESKGLVGNFLNRVSEDISLGANPRSAFHLRQEECMDGLQRDIKILAALTAVAPLLGLLGTVMGMIDTFDASAALSANTGEQVAGGISQALITTQLGLIIALPGVFGVSKLRSLLHEAEIQFSTIRAVMLAKYVQYPTQKES